MDSVSNINVFVQVAETRSFVAAGRLLGVSASAVGKSIVRLEERLGVRLFNRSTRSVTLTDEGLLFLERSRRILAEIEAAEQELTQTTGTPQGRLRVSLPLVGDPFLPTLGAFKKMYPDIMLDLDFSDRRVDIIEEGFDAVIRSGEVDDSRLAARRLGDYRMLLVAAPEYFKQHGTPVRPDELAQHACIQFRYPNTGKLQMWPIHKGNTDSGLQLPVTVVCNNLEARISFALQGIGIAYLPDFAIQALLTEGKLLTILEDYTETTAFRIMWPYAKQPVPRLRVFIDFLVQHLFSE